MTSKHEPNNDISSCLGDFSAIETTELALLLGDVVRSPVQRTHDVADALKRAVLTDDLAFLLLEDDDQTTIEDAAFRTATPTCQPRETATPVVLSSTASNSSTHRANASRQRQRQELEYLRVQVREMEDQLSRLHQEKRPTASSSPTTESAQQHSESTTTTTTQLVAWERIAKHQMRAKQKAEAENAKLREMLQGQLKIARGLEKLLRKKRTSDSACIDASESKRRRQRGDSLGMAAEIHSQLAQNLEALHNQVREVFQANGLAVNRGDLVRVHTDSSISGELTIEVLYSKVFPFDMASTSAAVWKCSSLNYLKLPQGHYSASCTSDDTLQAKFEIQLQIKRQSVPLHVDVVLKRYKETAMREVYVWDSMSTVSATHAGYEGLQLLDHGWTVVETLETSDPANPLTIVQCCSQFTPDVQSLLQQHPTGMLSDVLIASYNRNYETLYETVENFLLEGTLAKQ